MSFPTLSDISQHDAEIVTNFIQLISPQPVDQFLQTKLH